MKLGYRDMIRSDGSNGRAAFVAPRLCVPACRLSCLCFCVLAVGCRTADPTTPPPPGGGRTFVLDQAVFTATVAPVLTARGCDNAACHGGGIRGTFALSPAADKDLDFDFEQSRLQVDGALPESSPLLRKPLFAAAGGSAHAGEASGSGFASMDDPDYQAILAWIAAGEYR